MSWKKGVGQQKKHALDLTWVGLSRRSAFKITTAASIKSSGLCTYRGVSMGEQQEARCKLVGSLEFTATTNETVDLWNAAGLSCPSASETNQTWKITENTCFWWSLPKRAASAATGHSWWFTGSLQQNLLKTQVLKVHEPIRWALPPSFKKMWVYFIFSGVNSPVMALFEAGWLSPVFSEHASVCNIWTVTQT